MVCTMGPLPPMDTHGERSQVVFHDESERRMIRRCRCSVGGASRHHSAHNNPLARHFRRERATDDVANGE
jgi:hypothetical protein